MKRLMMACVLGLAASNGLRAETITLWDFQLESEAPFTGTNDPTIGSGSISHLGVVTHPGFNSGNNSSDPVQPGLGHQTQTYPGQSLDSGTAGIQFSVDTTGYENVVCSFDMRTSNTSSRWYQIRYTTNGVDFQDFASPVRLERFNTDEPPVEIGVGDFWSNGQTVDFSNTFGVSNNPNFAFQVVSVFSPVAFTEFLSGTDYDADTAYEAARNRVPGFGAQSNYAGGTWRFDMVTVQGDPMSGAVPNLVNARPYHSSFPDHSAETPDGPDGQHKVDTSVSLIQRSAATQLVGLENITSSLQGINGIVLDFDSLDDLGDISLEFKMSPQLTGADASIDTWGAAPAPIGGTPTLLAGQGVGGSDRVLVQWENNPSANAIVNRYLCIQITFSDSSSIELYLGHLLGEVTGGDGATFSINFGADLIPIRAALAAIATASTRVDIDKNGLVQVQDITAMRTNTAAQLSQITIPEN